MFVCEKTENISMKEKVRLKVKKVNAVVARVAPIDYQQLTICCILRLV